VSYAFYVVERRFNRRKRKGRKKFVFYAFFGAPG